MSLFAHIFDKIYILSVDFSESADASLSLVSYKRDRKGVHSGERKTIDSIAASSDSIPKAILLLAVSGRGVITKEEGSEIAKKVSADSDTFLFTSSGSAIYFVRREQLRMHLDQLKTAGIQPFNMVCLPDDTDQSLKHIAERFFSENSNWKQVLRPSAEGSLLASLAAKRLRIPILVALLALLVANFAVSSRVGGDHRSANAELAALRKVSSTDAATNERRQRVINEFSHQFRFEASYLSDIIASSVPSEIMLNELNIAPIVKTPENAKPIVQRGNTIAVSGETSVSEAVSDFVDRLSGLGLGTVRLTSLEQDREHTALLFRIEITI